MKERRPTSVHAPAYRLFLKALVAARKGAGLTQVQASRLLGWPQPYISRCESGERRIDVLELVEFARIYKKPAEYFLRSLLGK